ncbi:MAG: M1 family aminopeptidase [Planctomycetota bacterium]
MQTRFFAFRLGLACLLAMLIARRLIFLLAVLVLGVVSSPVTAVEHVEVCRYCQGLHRENDASAAAVRKYAPDRKVDVLRIKIDVTPDFEQRTIAGETTVTFSPISQPVEQLRLDARDLRVANVTGTQSIAEYVATDDDITILFSKPIAVGKQASVTIRYTAEPKQGLYFRTEAMGYPAGDDHLWTQGETHEAPHWFPCFDYPNERSATEVICRVPPAMTVLSNGRQVSEQVDPTTGLKAVHWVQEKPHVNYLVCLVAGHLAKLEKSHGDLRLRFFSQPSLAEHAANSFADSDQIIAYFEQEIGIPFPWEKYDQVTIRDFTAGGMENTTLTTLTHRTIYSDETENIYSSRGLDAHEAAHQWFGDYVTCEDWSHLWLNEGFATYYTHLYNGHRLGRDEMLYGLYRDATQRVLTQEDDTRPIVYRGYEQAWEQFDFRAYPKGSWVLHMLRSQLGDDVYRQAIKLYLEKHALSSVITADLIAELEDASGRSLDQFFDQYVYHGGFPKLKITHKWLPKEKLAHVHVEQTQQVSDDVLLFTIPSELRFHVGDQVIDHAIAIEDTEHDFYVPLPAKPDVVRFDPEFKVLAEVNFKKPQAMLEQQLRLSDDVVGRLRAVEALSEKETKAAVAALEEVLQADPFYGVRIAAAKGFGKMQTDEAFATLEESLDQSDARVRLAVVEAIARYYRPEALAILQQVANEEANPAVAATAISGLGKFDEAAVADSLKAALAANSLKDEETLAAMDAIGDLNATSLRGRLIEVLRDRRGDLGGRGYAEGLPVVAKLWHEADDQTPAYQLLTESLNDPSPSVRKAAAEALGELGDLRAAPLLRSLAESADDRVSSAAKDALEQLENESPATPQEIAELRKLVRELTKQQKRIQKSVKQLESKANAGTADAGN